MATTLWDKFQSAVRYLVGTEQSGVATYRVSDSTKSLASLGGTVLVPEGPPTTATDGVDIAGLATVNVIIEFDDFNQTATLLFYYFKGGTWFAGETLDVTTGVDIANIALPPIDTEGYDRIFVRVTALSGDLLTRSVFPHNQ